MTVRQAFGVEKSSQALQSPRRFLLFAVKSDRANQAAGAKFVDGFASAQQADLVVASALYVLGNIKRRGPAVAAEAVDSSIFGVYLRHMLTVHKHLHPSVAPIQSNTFLPAGTVCSSSLVRYQSDPM